MGSTYSKKTPHGRYVKKRKIGVYRPRIGDPVNNPVGSKLRYMSKQGLVTKTVKKGKRGGKYITVNKRKIYLSQLVRIHNYAEKRII